MKEMFVDKNFRTESLGLILKCHEVLERYAKMGLDLSLRQLYYQLVTQNIIPNNEKSYSRLGNVVNDARLAGMLDWDMIVDRGRETIKAPHWSSPAEIIRSAAAQFRIDKWADQPCHVEVMCEKQALEGVFVPVCRELDVPFASNKGYSSQSFMYRKGRELLRYAQEGKDIHIIYFGDHDPSGLDMDRDVADRLRMFIENFSVDLVRAALTMPQIKRHKPPPNPAKFTDSRAGQYVKLHGSKSWELDALNPAVLADLVRNKVMELRDEDIWDEAVAREREMRDKLERIAEEQF